MSVIKNTAGILPALVFVMMLGATPISGPIFGVPTATAFNMAPNKSVQSPSSLTRARKQIDQRDYSGALISLEAAKRQAVARAGLDPRITPYSFRHTNSKYARKKGVPKWEVEGLLGHRAGGARATETYAA